MTEALPMALARILLPGRSGQGMLAMLEIYYDDSGTHARSDVIVWGGIAGHAQYISELQSAWQARLNNPCEGKPPIRKFSSYDLAHADGEFQGYNEAEKDLTRRNFRQVIVEAGLSVLSYGISATDWHELADRNMIFALRSPEHTILALAIKGGCQVSLEQDESLAFVFDKGCTKRADIPTAFERGVTASEIDPDRVSYGLSPVLGNAGLQAADLVAHETYRLFCDFRQSGEANPGPHLSRLRDGAHDFQARWIGRQHIEDMLAEMGRKFMSGEFGS